MAIIFHLIPIVSQNRSWSDQEDVSSLKSCSKLQMDIILGVFDVDS